MSFSRKLIVSEKIVFECAIKIVKIYFFAIISKTVSPNKKFHIDKNIRVLILKKNVPIENLDKTFRFQKNL